VNSFTGHLVDVDEVGEICRERDIKFVVNGTQAIGAKALNLKETRVDAVTSCGFKWLCGPYGTGFCWVEPALLGQLEYNQAYWLTLQEGVGLQEEMIVNVDGDLGAKRYDVFGTANFHNFIPWTASVEYLLSKGISSIENHNERLVEHLVKNIDSRKFEVISPEEGEEMSSIAVISHQEGKNQEIYARLLDNGYYVSLRNGRLRISPHLYNTLDEIDAVLDLLRFYT
jgi:cysteine desulfurase/selenocysteine lyase